MKHENIDMDFYVKPVAKIVILAGSVIMAGSPNQPGGQIDPYEFE